jgi:hypothetical protein
MISLLKADFMLFVNLFVGWAWYMALEKPLIIHDNKLCERLEQKLNHTDYQLLNGGSSLNYNQFFKDIFTSVINNFAKLNLTLKRFYLQDCIL